MIDLPPADPGIEFSIASRGISKGLAQTDGAQVVARGHVALGRVQFGAQIKNVSLPVPNEEAAIFASIGADVLGFELAGGINYRFQTGSDRSDDDDTLEFIATVNRKFGRVAVRANAVYTADDIAAVRKSLYIEGGAVIEVGKATSLSAGIGRRDRDGGPDYTAFNAGITHRLRETISADLRLFDTAQSVIGTQYRRRVVASLRARF